MVNKSKPYILWSIFGLLLISILVLATTTITENLVSTGNITASGTRINFSTNDASIRLQSSAHSLFGNDYGEPIEIHNNLPSAKGGIGWYSYDRLSDRVRATGWIVCHYNSSSNGDEHQHCSIETLDNTTGTPTLNSHFEIDYGSNVTRAQIGFPSADVNFISNQKLYFGDGQNAWIFQNGTSGELHLDASSDIAIESQLDLRGNDITAVDDVFGVNSLSIDIKPDSTFRIFPSGITQSTVAFVFSNDSNTIPSISATGVTNIDIKEQLTTYNLNVTNSSNSATLFQVKPDGVFLRGNNNNGTMDRCTLSSGICNIGNSRTTANTNIFCNIQSVSGTAGGLAITGRTAGFNYTVTSTSGSDASTVACMLIEPMS